MSKLNILTWLKIINPQIQITLQSFKFQMTSVYELLDKTHMRVNLDTIVRISTNRSKL